MNSREKRTTAPYNQARCLTQRISGGGYEIRDLGPYTGYQMGAPGTISASGGVPPLSPDLGKKPPPGRYIFGRRESTWSAGRTYDPMGIANLYMELVHTEPTEEGVLAFVHKYGRLGCEEYLVYDPATPTEHAIVEPVDRYFAEIVRIKLVFNLLQMSRTSKNSKNYEDHIGRLSRLIGVRQTGHGGYVHEGSHLVLDTWLESRRENQVFRSYYRSSMAMYSYDMGKSYSKGDLLQTLARSFAMEQTNLELVEGVNPIAYFDPKIRNLLLCPRYLLAALYLQIAIEIAGLKGLRTCDVCGGPLPFGSNAKRITCSEACKSEKYRLKKGQSEDANEN